MSLFEVIILGIVEGVMEFLPISSTAHLIMVSTLLGIDQTDFVKTFEIVIQFGAMLAIVFMYIKKLFESPALLLKLFVAFIPTAVIGFILYPYIKDLFFDNLILLSVMLILGGVALLFFDRWFPEDRALYTKVEDLSLMKSFYIGVFQSLSLIPGVSRAASTLFGSQIVGLDRARSVEFSFLLGLPTIGAAAGYDLLRSGYSFSNNEYTLILLGSIVSFIFAYITVTWLLEYISRHTFKVFGIYRIIIGILFLVFFAL
jgi:undecaprenyl-diphosphatase